LLDSMSTNTPSTQTTDSVAHPDISKATAPAASPTVAKQVAPLIFKTPVKRVTSSSKKPMPVAKPADKTVKPASAAARPASRKLLKPKKIKLVRDSFIIPKLEYLMLDALKLRADALGKSIKKNELVRAGIKALAAMPESQFLAAIKAVAPGKTGHPGKN